MSVRRSDPKRAGGILRQGHDIGIIQETLRLPDAPRAQWLALQPAAGDSAPRIVLDPGYRAPLEFTPYFAAGGRVDGSWRLSWLPLAPEPAG